MVSLMALYRYHSTVPPFASSLLLSSSSSARRSSRGNGARFTLVSRLAPSPSLYHDGDDLLGGSSEGKAYGTGWHAGSRSTPLPPHRPHCTSRLQGVIAAQQLRKFTPIHILPRGLELEQEEDEWRSEASELTRSSLLERVHSLGEKEHYSKRTAFERSLPPYGLSPPLLMNRLQEPSSTHISLRCFLALRHCWKSGKYFYIPTWNEWYLLAPSWALVAQMMEGMKTENGKGVIKEERREGVMPLPSSSSWMTTSVASAGGESCPSPTSLLAPFWDKAGSIAWLHRIHPRYECSEALVNSNRENESKFTPGKWEREEAVENNNEKDEIKEEVEWSRTVNQLQQFRNEKATELYRTSGTEAWEKSILHPLHGHNNQAKSLEKEIYDAYGLDEDAAEGNQKGKGGKRRSGAAGRKGKDKTLYYIPEEHLFELNDGIQWPLLTSTLIDLMRSIFGEAENGQSYSLSHLHLNREGVHERLEGVTSSSRQVGGSKEDHKGNGTASNPIYGIHPPHPVSSSLPRQYHQVLEERRKQIREGVLALLQFYRLHLQRLEVYDSNGGGWSIEEEDLFITESLDAWKTLGEHLQHADHCHTATGSSSSNSSRSAVSASPPDDSNAVPSLPSISTSRISPEEKQQREIPGEYSHETRSCTILESEAVSSELDVGEVKEPVVAGKEKEGAGVLILPTEEEVVAHSRRFFRAYTHKANCQLRIVDSAMNSGDAAPSSFSFSSSTPLLTLVPLVDIPEGTELTVHYGREWWTEHFLYPLLLLREKVVEWERSHTIDDDSTDVICAANKEEQGTMGKEEENMKEKGEAEGSGDAVELTSLKLTSSFLMKWIREMERLVARPEDVFEPFPTLRPVRLTPKKKKRKTGKGLEEEREKKTHSLLLDNDPHGRRYGHPCAEDGLSGILRVASKYQLYNASTKQRASSAAVVAVAVQQSVLDPSWLWDCLLSSPSGMRKETSFSSCNGLPEPRGDKRSVEQGKGNEKHAPASHVFELSSLDQLVPISRLRQALKIKLLEKQHKPNLFLPTFSQSNEEKVHKTKDMDCHKQNENDSAPWVSLYSTILQRWQPSKRTVG